MDAPPLNAEDIEKGQSKFVVEGTSLDVTTAGSTHEGQVTARHGVLGYFQSLLHSELTEARGIQRVPPGERHKVRTTS